MEGVMSHGNQNEKKKKGFFGKIMDKLDKKLAEKASKSSCCSGGSDKDKGSSCC
jgi:hypothetical protein